MEKDNDEHVPLGESQPCKLVKTKVYLKKKILRFPIQPTEINRHTDEPSDAGTTTHLIYYAVDTGYRELIDEIISDTQINLLPISFYQTAETNIYLSDKY